MMPARAMAPTADYALEPLLVLPPAIAADADVRDALVEFARRVQELRGADLVIARCAAADRLAELRPELAQSPEARTAAIDDVLGGRMPASIDPEVWPDLVELPGLPPVPTWNSGLLPDALRPWLSDVAERTQCPPEYAAVGAIVALGSVIGRACAIRPKQHDDWTVVANLWGAAVGAPSLGKTPSLQEATRPLRWLAQQSSAQHADRQYEREAIDAKRRAFADEMKKAAKRGIDLASWRERYDALEAEAAAADAQRRYVVYDATVEKLGELLRDSPRGLLLFRDELSGWFRTLDKAGHENDRAFYLTAWDGSQSYVYDRIARGTINIDAACVSILGGIQPGPLGSYLRDVIDGGCGDDGLIQRFQVAVYPDPPRTWRNVDRWPDSEARDAARDLFVRLAAASAEDLGAVVDGHGEGIPFVRFDAAAQAFFDGWRTELENRLRAGDEHPALEAHLTKYRSLLPSLALIFQLADAGRGPVALVAAKRAAAWCELLEAHARRIYATVSSGQHNTARALLAKVRAGKLQQPFAPRDVYRAQWSGLTEPDAVDAAIAALERHGWLRRVTVRTGGRPRHEIQVHPSLRRPT